MIRLSSTLAKKTLIATAFGAGLATLAGCGLGAANVDAPHDTTVVGLSGTLHGGPNPAIGSRVVLYATTSTNYGVGVALEEANQQGATAHQDTDQYGQFQFAPGYTCPAGQQAYVVAYGGNTGGNANNPNSILMTALGPCENLSAATSLYINEATTVAATYALANFIQTTIDSSSIGAGLPAVFIGAPATNNGGGAGNNGTVTYATTGTPTASGCVSTTNGVANSYYPNCPVVTATNNSTAAVTTAQAVAVGLRHAFTNATELVNTSTGVVNATNAGGAAIPTVLFNTIANIVQTCVNSPGGGGTTLAGNSTTSAAGTTNDGTNCGRLFAYSSYTNNGTPTGTLTVAGNTVDAIKNMVKRPTGSGTMFDTGCSSNTLGTTPAATCLFNLASGFNGFFQPQLTAAPPDYLMALAYAKGSLSSSNAIYSTTSTPACHVTTTNNGLVYVQWLALDINDDVTILNSDQSTATCGNLLVSSFDGTVLGGTAPDNTLLTIRAVADDAFGHVILPNPGTDGVRVYQYNAGGTANAADFSMPLLATVNGGTGGTPATQLPADKAYYAMADSTNRIYLGSQNAQNTVGFMTETVQSHTAPSFTIASETSTTTSSVQSIGIDINNNAFFSKSTYLTSTAAGANTYTNASTTNLSGDSQSNQFTVTDLSGNAYTVIDNGTVVGTSQTQIIKYPYTYTPPAVMGGAGTLAFGTNSTSAAPFFQFPKNTNTQTNDGLDVSPRDGIIDGNNVIWFGDVTGSTNSTTPPFTVTQISNLYGFDVNNIYGTAQLEGCRTNPAFSAAITGYTVGASTTTFTTSATPPAVNGNVTLSGFPGTSSFLNGQVVTVTANVTTTGSTSFTVASTFGQAAGTSTDTGTAAQTANTHCGSLGGDANFPSSTPYNFYGTRSTAVDTMGNLWVANGVQGTVVEVIGLGNPTLPNYIHNGVSQKP